MTIFKITGRPDPRFNPFADEYFVEIMEAVVTAWGLIQQPAHEEIEDRITNLIAGRLSNDGRFEDFPFEVCAQHSILDITGKIRGRLDLRFKHFHSRRDYFVFEAKRLRVSRPGGRFSTEYPKYVGDEGMTAFVTGYYAPGFPAAGMLGYVMDGQLEKARVGLEAAIGRKRVPLKLARKGGLRKSNLPTTATGRSKNFHLGETSHNLAGRLLRLFHLLLPVR